MNNGTPVMEADIDYFWMLVHVTEHVDILNVEVGDKHTFLKFCFNNFSWKIYGVLKLTALSKN